MDFESIQQLIKTVSDSSLSFFEIEAEGISLKMKKETEKIYIKESSAPANAATVIEPVNQGTLPKASETASGDTLAKSSQTEKEEITEDLIQVKSPIVGTFFASSNPESEPFAKVGQKVKKGDTLCIIEAMKLMNEIECEADGEIVKVHAVNGQMVEYGQVLFSIK